MTEVLFIDYNFLSKLYIFFQQAKFNAEACDSRGDKAAAISKIQSLLSKLRLTLCDVDTYLRATGNPMPQEGIPANKTVVLKGTDPNMITEIPLTCDDDDGTRNQVDYVNSKDTVETGKELKMQYIELYDRLFSQSNASK